MDFNLSTEQESVITAVAGICSRFGDDYWLKRDRDGGLPQEFVAALAQNGWLGICLPEEYGGSGLGILEAGLMMRTIAESGAGMSGASSIHMNIFEGSRRHHDPRLQAAWRHYPVRGSQCP
jgi:acyl-CoA dehydrogenase